jgi:hypothetical protein
MKNSSMRKVARLTFDGVNEAVGQVGVVVLRRAFQVVKAVSLGVLGRRGRGVRRAGGRRGRERGALIAPGDQLQQVAEQLIIG